MHSFEMIGWGHSHYRAYETDRSSVVAGIGVNYQLTKSWNIGVNYNATSSQSLGILGLTTMRKSAHPSSIITSTLPSDLDGRCINKPNLKAAHLGGFLFINITYKILYRYGVCG